MLKLDAQTTALVLIDLQNGILPYAGGPHSAEQVVSNAAQLAARFRSLGAPVVLVRVGWSDSFAEALKQPVDQPAPAPAGGLPASWWEFPTALAVSDSDILVTKRQWGAFYGTDLELQLRRRGVKSIVLCGISTNIGVESTARAAWEHGYELLIAEDACSAQNGDMHQFAVDNIFPRLARVRSTGEILAALDQ
ncbi:hydrolase [Serratia entomophila]|uniref:hydrolase n=1 Tax=Serratia entomophila TaxID=42906 RepID=UPI00217AEBA3|nr:hydrolase [Serratia entomophila]CAI0767076.1 Isochorismatase family protein yecD [Serratia entomophila]CAI0767435.1 Isochorismatase family protein yecD [Serratia entomophila]CAI0767808.1 Isochorismatase family protein yecD [Serratia entomophila]CAI0812535.1 Isochorismatase family protein yecD [Serratia entomophila]CAI1147552.1 Isochorismatase family protein yecD [Serratia entomophila]